MTHAARAEKESMCKESLHRFCLFPIKYASLFEFYVKHVAAFWTVSEVDLKSDKADYDSLTESERDFIAKVLAFFANADGIVNENLAQRFMVDVTIPEARQFYAFQIGMESVHSHMYGVMIETLITDPTARDKLFQAITDIPSVAKKAEWALKWLGDDASFAERLIAFACVEGIFFSASFCAIYYLKKRGIMPGLTFSNELIARDEALHRDFACHLYQFLDEKLDEGRVHEIVDAAVRCELEFVDDALRVDIIGMNAGLMSQYVKVVADHMLVTLGYSKYYNETNPFEWMDMIVMQGKTNFFERRVGDYQKAGVMQTGEAATSVGARSLVIQDDF